MNRHSLLVGGNRHGILVGGARDRRSPGNPGPGELSFTRRRLFLPRADGRRQPLLLGVVRGKSPGSIRRSPLALEGAARTHYAGGVGEGLRRVPGERELCGIGGAGGVGPGVEMEPGTRVTTEAANTGSVRAARGARSGDIEGERDQLA